LQRGPFTLTRVSILALEQLSGLRLQRGPSPLTHTGPRLQRGPFTLTRLSILAHDYHKLLLVCNEDLLLSPACLYWPTITINCSSFATRTFYSNPRHPIHAGTQLPFTGPRLQRGPSPLTPVTHHFVTLKRDFITYPESP
jgi:hypothetical protein